MLSEVQGESGEGGRLNEIKSGSRILNRILGSGGEEDAYLVSFGCGESGSVVDSGYGGDEI